ncbi:hypothetical protein ABZP36_033292 [Zizania latifolia]
MASAAAGDPRPTPVERPGGWLSGLVSGAGRLLAAVLGPDSPDSGTGSASSTPESPQSASPPCGPRGSGDHCNTDRFAPDSYQFNQSGKEIVLKDCGEGSSALVSEIEPKHAIMQLLLQETYSRSECDKLIKIIQERVVDSDSGVVEPSIVLPIAWQASQQQDPAEYSSFIPNTCSATSNVPGCRQQFDRNIAEEKTWLDMKRLSPVEGPCFLNTDCCQYPQDLKRSHSNTGDTVDESHSRSIRPKLNGLNISNKQDNMIKSCSDIASFEEATTKDLYSFREIPEDTKKLFKDIPLLGTDNLTFSDIVSYDDTANDIVPLHGKLPAATAQTSYQADWDNRNTTMFYPYSNQDPVNTFPIKAEPLDDIVRLEPDIMDLAHKNHDTHTICNDCCSVSKLMFQEDIESIPSSSRGLQLENSSRKCTDRASLQWSTPTKRRSPANVYRRQNNNDTLRSKSEPLYGGKPMTMGHEPDVGLIQAKKPVGRPRKSRSWNATRQMENARRV